MLKGERKIRKSTINEFQNLFRNDILLQMCNQPAWKILQLDHIVDKLKSSL